MRTKRQGRLHRPCRCLFISKKQKRRKKRASRTLFRCSTRSDLAEMGECHSCTQLTQKIRHLRYRRQGWGFILMNQRSSRNLCQSAPFQSVCMSGHLRFWSGCSLTRTLSYGIMGHAEDSFILSFPNTKQIASYTKSCGRRMSEETIGVDITPVISKPPENSAIGPFCSLGIQ